MFRLISVLSLGLFVNNAFAEEPSDIDLELEAFHAAPDAEETKSNLRKADFNALDEEEEFSMDLSFTAPTQPVIDPDAELEPITEAAGSVEPDMDFAPKADDDFKLEEIEPAAVDPEAKDIEWDLDLSEDVEIGNTKITTETEKKSEAVNLDFLEE